MVAVKKSEVKSLHAAVDELAASNPELFAALHLIIANALQSETAVVVPAKSATKGKTSKVVLEDDEDDDDGEMVDADDEDEDDSEDELVLKPKGKAKASTTKPAGKTAVAAKASAKPAGKVKAKPAPEPEEEEEDEAEMPELDTLDDDAITSYFSELDVTEIHPSATGGSKELAAFIDDIGFDIKEVIKNAGATTPKEKTAAYQSFASRIYYTLDQIIGFELDDVIAAVQANDGAEDFKPAGRKTADKEMSAATMLFKYAFELVSED